jgi:hypothetical protein
LDSKSCRGIRGNENIDALAKQSFKCQQTDLLLPACDFRTAIINSYHLNGKQIGTLPFFNKLHDINPSLDMSPSLSLSNRNDQTVLLRCRIRHTKITHSYILTNDNAPICIACKTFTVKHFLLECHDFSQTRNRFDCVNSLKELFDTIPSKNVIEYLKKINLSRI